MTEQEFKDSLKEAKKAYDTQVESLARVFALLNNPVKAGQTVKDHIGFVLVENISVFWDKERLPCCVYSGEQLKADGKTPLKKSAKRDCYQSNMISFQ